MANGYKVAIVGATGLVGGKMIELLEESGIEVSELIPCASARSAGKSVLFKGKEWRVVTPAEGVAAKPQIALFSAGGSVSAEWAPKFAEAGCRVVDNSSQWRMDPTKKLVVPEINGDVITAEDMIIANPNCSTIQMVLALAPLHRRFGIKRIVVSTYQSVTGSGQKGINQMLRERAAATGSSQLEDISSNGLHISSDNLPDAYHYPIDLNVIPHIDQFLEDGNTKEEAKMINETHKIFDDYTIGVSATTVRVPVTGGHSESINVEFRNPFTIEEVKAILASGPAEESIAPGVILQDNPAENIYPTPLFCFGHNEVYVGRVRRDASIENGLNLWCVADNLRKGAATNAVQIAKLLIKKGLI